MGYILREVRRRRAGEKSVLSTATQSMEKYITSDHSDRFY